MRNSEVGSSGRNLHVSGVYARVFASERAYGWSSFIELSVSIYDPLTCNKRHTFPSNPASQQRGE